MRHFPTNTVLYRKGNGKEEIRGVWREGNRGEELEGLGNLQRIIGNLCYAAVVCGFLIVQNKTVAAM